MLKLTLLVLSACMLSGCVVSAIQYDESAPKMIGVDTPMIGETTTRAIGEVMVAQGQRATVPTLVLTGPVQFNKAEGEKSVWTCALTAQPGAYARRGTYLREPKGVSCYGPVPYQVTNADGSVNWNCLGQSTMGDICESGDGGYFMAFAQYKAQLKQDFDQLHVADKAAPGSKSLVRELVYNGRSGDTVRLSYREITDDAARPALTEQLIFDLSESPTVGYRNLRLEIIEASNTQVTFRMLQGF